MIFPRIRIATFWALLLLLTQLPAFAQDGPSLHQTNHPLGRLEVPDTEEQRRFVEEHSLTNPEFRRKQGGRADAEGATTAQGSKQVRVIYLVPSDKSVRADYQSAIANAISNLQVFYKNQMGGGYTFSLHSPVVEVYQTPHTAAFYSTGDNARPGGYWEGVLGDFFALTGGGFNDPNNRWIIYADADLGCGQYVGGASGVAMLPANDLRGLTSQPTVPVCSGDRPSTLSVNRWIGGLGHELGHALNLSHPPGCDGGSCAGGMFAYNSLMYIGYLYYPNTYLLDEDKSVLFAGGFFDVLVPPPTVQFDVASYQVGEADGRVVVQVNRSDASAAASVNYSTSDNSGLTPCGSVTGAASSRCDYATSIGTLSFAPGESSKTITIPLVDDAYAEGTESLTLALSSPSGAGLGTLYTATITIADNEAAKGANPVDQSAFFVRQHYIDFLGREPDAGGYAAWQGILNNCAAGSTACDRVEVSSAFFRSPEFQERVYFVYRFYSAVGRVPLYSDFMPDLARVSGFLSAEQLEANKAAFVGEFTSRQVFQDKYGSITDPSAYVTALLQTLGLSDHPGKGAWVNALSTGAITRAQALRQIVESSEVYNKYYTEAFVVMQYFGYLRRDADISYLTWIQTMNDTGGDYRTMINGFLNSAEYRQRFGD